MATDGSADGSAAYPDVPALTAGAADDAHETERFLIPGISCFGGGELRERDAERTARALLALANPLEMPRLDVAGLRVSARVADVYDGDTLTAVVPLAVMDRTSRRRDESAADAYARAHAHAHGQAGADAGFCAVSVRFAGIDAEEMRGGSPEQHAMAVRARDELIRMILHDNGVTDGGGPGPLDLSTRTSRRALFARVPCLVDLACTGFDKYGRVLARVMPPASRVSVDRREMVRAAVSCVDDYSHELMRRGLATPYRA